MSDLTDFLLACIAEDEAMARSAGAASEHDLHPWAWVDYNSAKAAEHGFRWDPRRVLAECAAKRRIVEEHPLWTGRQQGERRYCSTCVGHPIDRHGHVGIDWPCETLRLLALPYADRPGFREEWRL